VSERLIVRLMPQAKAVPGTFKPGFLRRDAPFDCEAVNADCFCRRQGAGAPDKRLL